MDKLKAALAAVLEKVGAVKPALAVARSRYRAAVKRAARHSAAAQAAQKQADELRAPHPAQAVKYDEKARRQSHRAYAADLNVQARIAQVKRLVARIEKLYGREVKLKARIKKLSGPTVSGNTVSGGEVHDRIELCALSSAAACASGKRPNFYSQVGAWDVDHCITGESYGERSDCSSWFTSVYKSCGLPDPNGGNYTGGYTGTLVANGKQISTPEVGCAVIYGPGTGHHVELFVGPGDKTIGHGSSPVDPGVIDLFGDGDYRFFKYV